MHRLCPQRKRRRGEPVEPQKTASAEPRWHSPAPPGRSFYATLPTSPFPFHVWRTGALPNYHRNFLWKSDHWVLKGKPSPLPPLSPWAKLLQAAFLGACLSEGMSAPQLSPCSLLSPGLVSDTLMLGKYHPL